MTSDSSSSAGGPMKDADTITDVEWTEESVRTTGTGLRGWAAARVRRFARLWPGVAALAAVIVVAAAGAWLWFLNKETSGRLVEVEARAAVLEEQVAMLTQAPDLASDVGDLEKRLAAAQASIADEASGRDVRLSGIEDELVRMAGRLDGIEREIAGLSPGAGGEPARPLPGLEDRLDTLSAADLQHSGRIDALETEVAILRQAAESLAGAVPDGAVTGDGGAALVVATVQLREAVLSGDPFRHELESVAVLETGDPEVLAALDRLEEHAEGGVPTRDELEESLPEALAAAVDADRVAAATGWFDETVARLESLVTVKRIDGAITGTDVASAASRIETGFAAGDLDAALAEIESLPAAAAEAMRDWENRARTRIEALEALELLHRRSIALVADAG